MSLVTLTDDLATRFRSDVDDPLRGPASEPDVDALWSVSDVNAYMEDAVDRVARDTRSSFKTLTLQIKAGEPDVALPSSYKVLDITRAVLANSHCEVCEVSLNEGYVADDYGAQYTPADWETKTGRPRVFTREYTPGALRLCPTPVDDDALIVTATVVGLFAEGGLLPLQERPDIALVLMWMKKLAYSKHDADTYDPQRAAKFEAEYLRTVVDRRYEAQRVRRAPRTTQFSW